MKSDPALRIGIVTHKYPRTVEDRMDARIHVYDFAHALVKHTKVFVFAPDYSGEKERDTPVPVTWFPMSKNNYYNVYNDYKILASARRAAVAFAQKNRIDFCLAAWAIPAGYLAYHINKTLGIPYAVWALGSDIHSYGRYPILGDLILKWLHHADFRFANSFALQEEVQRLTGKECIYMPVISDFPTRTGKRTSLQNTVCRFLYVGRLEKVKGIDILIDACKRLMHLGATYRLTVIGNGNLRLELETDVRRSGLDACVRFFGNQDKVALLRHMLEADCLVIPSRKESFPQVLLEAARVGLPAIATDTGDSSRVLSKYHCGMLIEKGSSMQLAESMIRFARRRQRFSVTFQNGLRRFVREATALKPEIMFLETIGSRSGLYKKRLVY